MTYLPNESYIIEDNEEAMKLCVECNVLDKLKPAPGANSAYTFFDKGPHWLMLSFHEGHEREQDNGFGAMLLSKTTHNKFEASKLFTDCMEAVTMGGFRYGFIDMKPLSHQ